ncbi:MAG: ATP-binding protein [Dehalococcoidales bacterium]|nr:ATP-binding protein [Dehalococcoidales bacterium]
MASDIEILMKAREKEDDPRRSKMGWKSWEFYTVGATKDDVKRLVDGGYVVVDGRRGSLTKYLITDKARKVIWANEMEQKFKAIPRETIMGSLDLVVGFDDIKEVLADTVSSRRKMNILLTGPPACAKSVLLDALREAVPAPQSYIAFGSRTSAAGLSDMLFDTQPELLLFDEVDKCRSDAISVLLGLMEKGEVIETKSNRTRGIKLRTQVIAACNRQDKFTPEFLSRFAFKPHFPEYTRQEFIDVVVGMLDRAEGCPPEVARLIGVQVYDLGLGDVRAARGVWQMMHDSTPEEVNRVIRLNLKYLPDEQAEIKRKTVSKKIAIARLPGFME